MKPIALDTVQLQFLGDRQDPCDLGQPGVKGGVETRHLRKPGKVFLCEADDRQRRRRMQRCKGGCRLELQKDRIINQAMLPELWPAMHDTMSDGGGQTYFRVGKKAADAGDRFPLTGNGHHFRQQRFSAGILCVELAFLLADRLGLAA